MEEGEAEAVEDYEGALNELTCNSKPHINMLTMLADEKKKFASKIVQVIETRINQVQNTQKLPLLYLIDSIVKNCPDSPYKDCFAKNLTNTFVQVFEKGDEKTRGALFKLRQTWPAIFPASRLLHIDIKVHNIDHAWPLVDPKSSTNKQGTSIHVNPKFLSPNAPAKPIVPDQELPKFEPTLRDSRQNSSQIELQNVYDARRIQKETIPPIIRPAVVNQSFANALTSGPSSRDPRIRNAVQKRPPVAESSSFVEEDSRPVTYPNSIVNKPPADRSTTYAKKIIQHSPTKKSVPYDEKPSPKPMSVVAKVLPNPRVLTEPGRWTFRDDNNSKHASFDVKIAKLPANRDTTKRSEIFHSSVVDRDKPRNEFAQTSPVKSPRGGGRGAGADRNRGGQGRNGSGGHPSTTTSNDIDDSSRKLNLNQNFQDRRNEAQKRPRSQSPVEETVVKSKRERTYAKSRRDDNYASPMKDRDDRDLVRKNIKESSTIYSSNFNPTKKSSFVAAAAADTDLRNNSTDSDRSGRDVDFRTSLPLKKRKHSHEDSLSTPEGFPLDQVLPKDDKFKKKQSPKSEVYLDELLFGPNEDHDMRFTKQRTAQQSPKSNRNNSKPTSSSSTNSIGVEREKRRTTKICVDPPCLPDESVDTLVEYHDNIIQRVEQRVADGSISPQSYGGNMSRLTDRRSIDEKPAPKRNVDAPPPSFSRKPKSSPSFASSSIRPKMRPIPKTAATRVPPSNSLPVFQNPAKLSVSDRQSMRPPPYARSGLPVHPPKPLMNFNNNSKNARFPIDPTLNSSAPDPIPSNNRILVDGVSYEVKYIDHVPIIERNGLPHRTRFIGLGRDIVIDDVPYSLKFDETKDILIDGQMHKIRFGGPSRELYMGNYPFRGSFGGPPIFATINGMKHKILLSGPTPEVKIDPEPSMDLVRYPLPPPSMPTQHMPEYPVVGAVSAAAGAGFAPQPPNFLVHKTLLPTPAMNVPPPHLPPTLTIPPPTTLPSLIVPPPVPPFQQQPQVNVNDLLHKLVSGGIIGGPLANVPKPAQVERKPIVPTSFESADGTTRSDREPAIGLKDFNISVLKIRYKPIVNSLYQERIQCSTCGMRFVVGDQQKYSQHLDWHFKQNRLEKHPGRSMSRPWYFAAEDWINFEEFADVNAPKAKSAVFENAQSDENSNRFIMASTDSVIIATRDEHNECAVCQEKFEQFWDEDEEAWKLRNATLVDDKAYHPLCYQDVSNVERDIMSPSFGSPVNDKPVFWACEPIAVPDPISSATNVKVETAEPLIDDVIVATSLLGDVMPSFITDTLQKSSTASTSSSSSDAAAADGSVKRNLSSQDLLFQSVLSVVSNVPTSLVNNLTNIASPLNVNRENSSSSSNDDEDSRTVKICVNNLKNINNDDAIDVFGDDFLLYGNDDHKTMTASTTVAGSSADLPVITQSPPPTSSNAQLSTAVPTAAAFLGISKTAPSLDGESSGGTTPLRDERTDSPGTPVHDEAASF